ncbi:hypothetical protein CSB11_01385 [Candidatus Campbellbacteria bacterium]|nr:MAG: hypothetical protein CSB11_01385 [Candidatus Campbellbacteria bacterium]
MYRILGLLNDEEKYQNTAHNIGGEMVYAILRNKNENIFQNSSELFYSSSRKAKISNGFFEKKNKEYEYEFVLPQNFMNNSGDSLNGVFSKNQKERKEEIKNLIVIYDDIDLPFGEVKIVFNRGDGGHNGIKGIENKIKSKEYIKIKIGVCPTDFFGKPRKPKKESVAKYLTSKKLSSKYTKRYKELEEKIVKILEEIMTNGYQKAMNNFNGKK